MNNTNKKENSLEQKIYAALIGLGVFALATVTVIYGVRTQKADEFAKENVQLGEANPVTGPVAATEEKDSKKNMEDTEEKDAVQVTEAEKEKTVETMTLSAGYNGKDKLSWPVTGNVIIPYSMDTTVYFETLDQYQCSPALFIKAEKGTEVKSVYGGTVINVSENSRYGNQITLDMGNGYKMSYGQLSDIPYKKGDVVEKGSLLGKIAEPTDYFALEGSHLYMKMTLQGKAVNPTDYMEP